MKQIAGVVPTGILDQHVAVLGKTGSGKTSTAKLLVEHVVAEHARVCVLDPIKSDWWGLTSSADGRRPGLPFHILGGPRGHVPLHESAGAAIAEIVANGSLPLSVIDMADFKPGGQAQFFTAFAPTLLRKMRGVVYLVLEEAHLFAPKERSGIGEESMAIHWAKMLATAGRSKGVRLILVTQRTQALHNALLGSCDTMLAHRLTAPADQKPVIQWLQANASKEALEQVARSLSSLKTGDAWLCSGELTTFERVHFPRIATYDNTATPTGDGETREIKTAPVDQDKLRAIIGDAVEEAKANDPRELKKQIAEKDRLIKQLQTERAKPTPNIPANIPAKEVPVLTDADRQLIEKLAVQIAGLHLHAQEVVRDARKECLAAVTSAVTDFNMQMTEVAFSEAENMATLLDKASVTKLLQKLNVAQPVKPTLPPSGKNGSHYSGIIPRSASVQRAQAPASGEKLPPGEHAVLTAALTYPDGVERQRLTILTGYKRSSRDAYIVRLAAKGLIKVDGPSIHPTEAGIAALPDFEPLPTGAALVEYWRQRLPEGERRVLDVLLREGGDVPREVIDRETNYKRSSRDAYLVRMKARGIVEIADRGMVRASADLLQGAR